MSSKKSKIPVDADSAQLSHGLFGGIDKVSAVELELESTGSASNLFTASNKRKRITLLREKSGRGGKVVTLVVDLPPSCNAAWREGFLKRAKQQLGCGGKLQASAIELQGDCRAKLAQMLENEGFKAVVAGG